MSRQSLRWAGDTRLENLAEQISANYRDGNFRIAISGDLLNRLMPPAQTVQTDVNDNIAGAEVVGNVTATNRLRVRLFPDRSRIRIGIEAHGDGVSHTAAWKGPVVFGNRGRFRYLARKLLMIDRRGVRVWRAEADAETENMVTGVETDFDVFPILGALVRSIALSKRADEECFARSVANSRIRRQVTEQLDNGVHKRLANAEKHFDKIVLQPLRRLGANPIPVAMETTKKRIIVKYRIAGFTQLGANTPRPMAMSDSLLSTQMHQSVINNVIQRLDLNDKTYNLRDLYRTVSDKLGATKRKVPEELPGNVVVQFTKKDPASVRFADGKATIVLNIAKLQIGKKLRWYNFSIAVNYVPDYRTLDAKFIRVPDPDHIDSFIYIDGIRRSGHRMLVAGIFE
ncbi:MAG: hypothetical protein IH991_13340, partial [Planctomycetes bacterium]|nr:hypothetical protein [Planctomycetota bacterium]